MDTEPVNPPTEQPEAPQQVTTVNRFAGSETNRMLGYRIWFHVRVELVTKVDAWRGVFPDSKASDESARVMCSRFLKWYEEEYPPTFDRAAAALGLSPYYILQQIKLMMDATLWEWDESKKKKVNTGRPDLKMRLLGMRELIKLVKDSEKWRREFVEQRKEKPTDMHLPPEHTTVEEWEKWAQGQDLKGGIERARADATKARDERLNAEGRTPAPAAYQR